MASSATKKCTKCKEWKDRESEFHKNKNTPDGLQSRCKVCRNAHQKKKYEDPVYHKRILERVKAYSQTEEGKKKRRIAANARVTSEWEKLKHGFGRDLRHFINGIDSPRNRELFGCTRAEFRAHIEAQFEPWMNPDNRGRNTGVPNKTWQLDHTIPYKAFPTVEELEKHKKIVCWYKNVRPLCSMKNNEERDHFKEDDKKALILKYQLEEIEREVLALI